MYGEDEKFTQNFCWNTWKEEVNWGLGEGLTTPRYKKKLACYEMLHRALELAGSCEYGNEPSGSIRGGEFHD
jgi:hypothetical protein